MKNLRTVRTRIWRPSGLTVVAFTLAAFTLFFWTFRCGRGEPGAVIDVNRAVDRILSSSGASQLEAYADAEFRSFAEHSSEDSRDPARIARVPKAFWSAGPDVSASPPTHVRIRPDRVVIQWALFGSSSHSMIIYRTPPPKPPRGFFGRVVTDRVFVVADDGVSERPASEARTLRD